MLGWLAIKQVVRRLSHGSKSGIEREFEKRNKIIKKEEFENRNKEK